MDLNPPHLSIGCLTSYLTRILPLYCTQMYLPHLHPVVNTYINKPPPPRPILRPLQTPVTKSCTKGNTSCTPPLPHKGGVTPPHSSKCCWIYDKYLPVFLGDGSRIESRHACLLQSQILNRHTFKTLSHC